MTTQPPVPQLALIALSAEWRNESLIVSRLDSADILDQAIAALQETQSRPEAELPEVTDEAVNVFQRVYGQNFVDGRTLKVPERIKRALQAAYGQQCAATCQSAVADSQLASDAHYVWQMMCAIVESDPSVDRIKARDTALSIFDRLSATRPAEVGGDSYPACGDREVLLYLMQQFDAESWECERCGHNEDTATMDSADYLRRYLAENPATPATCFVLPPAWKFNRAGVEAFVSGPNGGGWFERKGTLWQRTMFDLVDALTPPTPESN